MSEHPDPPALRAVYLLGGLQAEDFGEATVDIILDGAPPLLRFARPAYADLYRELERRGLQPVGVHFIQETADANGLNPVSWHSWKTPRGLHGRQIIQDWSEVRRSDAARTDESVAEFASKVRGYLRLVNFRLFQLARSYHDMLRYQLTGQGLPAAGTLFSNAWSLHVDGAIHAFLADAASLRDALAEGAWRFVLKETDGQVSSMGSFLKRAKTATHPLALEILAAGADGGWIKNLTDIRNDAIHVVPVAARQEHRLSEVRTRALTGDKTVPVLHHPLTDDQWRLPARLPRVRDYSDKAEVLASVAAYRAFAAASGDALEYAWRTLGHLMKLAEDVRRAANLQGKMLTITDEDLVEGAVVTFQDQRRPQ